MTQNDHIKRICRYASLALSLITLILLFYGAWLFDNGLVTKSQIFQSASIPLIGSIVALFKGR